MYLTYLSKPNFNKYSFEEAIQKAIGKRVTKEAENFEPTAEIKELLEKMQLRYNIDYSNLGTSRQFSYHTLQIPKHTHGYRTLTVPNHQLMDYQRSLVYTINKMKVLPHNAAHGYTKYRSCKTALEVHKATGAKWFLKLDLSDFFGSCKKEAVLVMLKRIYPFNYLSYEWLDKIFRDCFYNNALPQGAATSPVLSNLYMMEVDIALSKIKGLCYTRYADDLLFSSTTKFDYTKVVEQVKEILQTYDLSINPSKTRFGSFAGRNWNLGLMYNQHYEITVGHENKRKLKAALHNLQFHPNKDTERSVLALYNYYRYIEPSYFNEEFINKYYYNKLPSSME